jgi:hypothetical protein
MQIELVSMSALPGRGVPKLGGAKLFGSEFMPAGAASPGSGRRRPSLRTRKVPCLVARLKCQHQFATALKAEPMQHALR